MRWLALALLVVACDKKSEKPFHADRQKACEAFADRVMPSMRQGRLPVDESIAKECESSARINASNFECLMAAKSGDGIGACLDGGLGEKVPAASCALYAKHVTGLMAQELKSAMLSGCLAPEMKEATFDCVMAAKSDPQFKQCFGLTP